MAKHNLATSREITTPTPDYVSFSNIHNCIGAINLAMFINPEINSVILNISYVIPCPNGIMTRKTYFPSSPYYMHVHGDYIVCGGYGRLLVRLKGYISALPDYGDYGNYGSGSDSEVRTVPLPVGKDSHYTTSNNSKLLTKMVGYPTVFEQGGADLERYMFNHPSLLKGDVVSVEWPCKGLKSLGVIISPGLVFTWEDIPNCRFCSLPFMRIHYTPEDCPFKERHGTCLLNCSVRGIIATLPNSVRVKVLSR